LLGGSRGARVQLLAGWWQGPTLRPARARPGQPPQGAPRRGGARAAAAAAAGGGGPRVRRGPLPVGRGRGGRGGMGGADCDERPRCGGSQGRACETKWLPAADPVSALRCPVPAPQAIRATDKPERLQLAIQKNAAALAVGGGGGGGGCERAAAAGPARPQVAAALRAAGTLLRAARCRILNPAPAFAADLPGCDRGAAAGVPQKHGQVRGRSVLGAPGLGLSVTRAPHAARHGRSSSCGAARSTHSCHLPNPPQNNPTPPKNNPTPAPAPAPGGCTTTSSARPRPTGWRSRWWRQGGSRCAAPTSARTARRRCGAGCPGGGAGLAAASTGWLPPAQAGCFRTAVSKASALRLTRPWPRQTKPAGHVAGGADQGQLPAQGPHRPS
jgi:hypothetical protein